MPQSDRNVRMRPSAHQRALAQRYPLTARLCLRPAHDAPGRLLDGGWWPRSGDPAGELTTLVAVLDGSRDQVMTVSLSVGGGMATPARLRLDDRVVQIGWLRLYHHLLLATYLDGRRIRLLVIPAKTHDPVAAAAMTMVLDPANHTQPSGILRAASTHLSVNQPSNGPLRDAPITGHVEGVVTWAARHSETAGRVAYLDNLKACSC
jgi:hypothetical protein